MRFLAMFLGLVLISCGNENRQEDEERITIGDDNRLETVETQEESSAAASGDASQAVTSQNGETNVRLEGDDQMRFNLDEIRVKAGQTVNLTLVHTGQLPENAMGHNFVLLKKGTDVTDFATRAMEASGNDYIPENTDEVIVHTEMIGGGEETSITFEAPEPGTYIFICSFPGHYMQMQGEFIVE